MESLIGWILAYKYFFIIPGAIIEGPILAIVCGFLMHTGVLDFWWVFVFLMLGDLISDVYWYYIGYYGGNRFVRKYGKYFSVTEENIQIVEKLYHRHHTSILLVSKLTMGFGFAIATVLAAGMVRIPFRKYMLINLIGQPFWTLTLLGVGYFLGDSYVKINRGIEAFSYGAFIIIAIAVVFGVGRYVRNRIIKSYS